MFELKALLLLLFFLLLEIAVLSLVLSCLVYQETVSYFKTKIYAKRQEKISKKIVSYLQNQKPLTHEQLFSHRSLLLSVLESFNYRLKGEEWETLKQKIVSHYLLDAARKKTKSLFWRRRNFAARVFAIFPLLEDESRILFLLDDPVFLVRSIAAVAAIKLPSEKGIELTLEYMAKSYGYSRYFYRDILLQGSTTAFSLITKIDLQKKDPKIHLACLEVFSGKTTPLPPSFLLEDLQSKDPEILLTSLKVLTRNPLQNAEKFFLSFLTHPKEQIRMEAAVGLRNFINETSLKALEKSLKDPSWKVRLQAAHSLKEMGEKGDAVLKKQDPEINQTSYEIAKYAMDFLG